MLIHAGMPIAGEPWRDALTQLSHHGNVNVKLSGQGTFIHRVDPELIADVTKVVLDTFGAGPRDVRLQLPDREPVDRLL